MRPSTHRLTGDELVIAGFTTAVTEQTITLEEANLVAGVLNGRTAKDQAPGMYIAKRTAQKRVRRIVLKLADQAAA